MLITNHLLPITNSLLPIANHLSPITNSLLPIAYSQYPTIMTTKKKHVEFPQSQSMPAIAHFLQNDNELTQYMRIRRETADPDNELPHVNLPFDKALKGSITFQRDPSVKNGKYIRQVIRLYKKTTAKRSASILETRYSKVRVSNSRVTVTMSFPLCDDPTRLRARMQNFANIIVDESDEIAALLNQEGDTKVQEAWHNINHQTEEGGDHA